MFAAVLRCTRRLATTPVASFARTMAYAVESRAAQHTLDFKAYITKDGKPISAWHDIPLWANEEKTVVNMVCEVPRWTNAKMEVNKELDLNPIVQDTKKGKLRFVHNCFPHHGYIWNYGGIPQTFEDPELVDKHTNCKGDGDPVDICDIGSRIATIGEVKQVKILGVMALIDEGETDWKILGIDVTDPLASQINDVDDIEKHMPGQLSATHEWFKIYKIPAGKPENQFAFNGEAKNKEFALGIIQECHEQWTKMVGRANEKISTKSTAGFGTAVTEEEARAIVDATPAPAEAAALPDDVHTWHYVKL